MRCFVVGNGPSLNDTNLDLLVGEVSYGMQRINLIYPDTPWRPTYVVIADRDITHKIRWREDAQYHLEQGYPVYFRKNFINIVNGFAPNHPNAVFLEFCWHYDAGEQIANAIKHGNEESLQEARHALPSEWHLPKICRYGGSMGAALQLAVLEGYNPIYIVGADLGLTGKNDDHFHPDYYREMTPKEAERDNIMLVRLHKMAKAWCEANGIEIYNATVGGELEVYSRVDYNSLF